MCKRFQHIAFGVILFAGIVLRLIGLHSIQPDNPDEAMYLRQARFMSTIVRYQMGCSTPVLQAEGEGIWRYIQRSDWYAKPCWLHAGLMAIPMIVWGAQEWAGLLIPIVFSLATVVLLYFFCRQQYNPTVGLVAAGILAISHYWLIYSRGFFAEVDTVFFVVLAYVWIIRGPKTSREMLYAALAGISTAVAILVHYRVLFVVAPLGLCLLLHAKSWRQAMLQGAAFMFACVLVLLGFELATRMGVHGLGGGEDMQSYFAALWERYGPSVDAVDGTSHTGWNPSSILDNIRHLIRWQGIAPFVLMCCGVIFSWRQNRRHGGAVLTMLVFPLLVLSLQVWVVARVVTILVPFACIAAGVGAAGLWSIPVFGTRCKPWIQSAVIVLLLAGFLENMIRNVPLLQNHTGYPSAVTWLADEQIRVVYATNETRDILGWYMPGLEVRSIRTLPEDAVLADGETVMFDGLLFHYYPASRIPLMRREAHLLARGHQQIRFPNLTHTWRHFLYDGTQAHSVREMREDMQSIPLADLQSIRIYTPPPEAEPYHSNSEIMYDL